MYRPCTHKTFSDHTAGRNAEGALIWKCSGCGTLGPWTADWKYWGNLECKVCWTAAIDIVACPACELPNPEKKRDPSQAKATEKPPRRLPVLQAAEGERREEERPAGSPAAHATDRRGNESHMNPNTGEIHIDVTEDEAKTRGLIPIPEADAERVINMNRHQRRAWAAKQHRAATPAARART